MVIIVRCYEFRGHYILYYCVVNVISLVVNLEYGRYLRFIEGSMATKKTLMLEYSDWLFDDGPTIIYEEAYKSKLIKENLERMILSEDWTDALMDIGQFGLTLAGGIIPPLDLLNVGISIGRGQWLGAAIGLLALIPVIGDGVGIVHNVLNILRRIPGIGRLIPAARAAEEAGRVTATLIPRSGGVLTAPTRALPAVIDATYEPVATATTTALARTGSNALTTTAAREGAGLIQQILDIPFIRNNLARIQNAIQSVATWLTTNSRLVRTSIIEIFNILTGEDTETNDDFSKKEIVKEISEQPEPEDSTEIQSVLARIPESVRPMFQAALENETIRGYLRDSSVANGLINGFNELEQTVNGLMQLITGARAAVSDTSISESFSSKASVSLNESVLYTDIRLKKLAGIE